MRAGGLLALSRAFGDAYMKGSLQFEGVRAGGDGYSSGFGVVAEPDTSLVDLSGTVAASHSKVDYEVHALSIAWQLPATVPCVPARRLRGHSKCRSTEHKALCTRAATLYM